MADQEDEHPETGSSNIGIGTKRKRDTNDHNEDDNKKERLDGDNVEEDYGSSCNMLEIYSEVIESPQESLKGHGLEERWSSVLDMGLGNDCKIVVGPEKEELSACKLILAAASPVFEIKFRENRAEMQTLEIPDVDSSTFKRLLQFIYTRQVNFTSHEEAMKLLQVAHIYALPDLTKKCLRFLVTILETNNIVHLCDILNCAVKYSESLKQTALQRVSRVTEKLLTSRAFLNLSNDSLVSILKLDCLNVDCEMDLIRAALKWASARCVENNIPVRGETLRSMLIESNVLQQLRFLTLPNQMLEDRVRSLGILTHYEFHAVKQNKSNGNCFMAYLSSESKPRTPHLKSKKRHVRKTSDTVNIKASETITEAFELCRDLEGLSAIILDAQIPDGDWNVEDNVYEEDIEVVVLRKKSCVGIYIEDHIGAEYADYTVPQLRPQPWNTEYYIYATGHFRGIVKYMSSIQIPLSLTSAALITNPLREDEELKINTTFHKPGPYPRHNSNSSADFTCLETCGHIKTIRCWDPEDDGYESC